MPSFPVHLNVYDQSRSNAVLYYLGGGKYSTNVEVDGNTYAFGGQKGVEVNPKHPPAKLRTKLRIGTAHVSQNDLEKTLLALEREFSADSYDRVCRNSNNFSHALCMRLTGTGIPDWVNLQFDLMTLFHGFPTLRI